MLELDQNAHVFSVPQCHSLSASICFSLFSDGCTATRACSSPLVALIRIVIGVGVSEKKFWFNFMVLFEYAVLGAVKLFCCMPSAVSPRVAFTQAT